MDKIYKNSSPKNTTMNFQNKNNMKKNDEQSESKEFMTKSKDSGRLIINSDDKTDNRVVSSHDIDKQINDLETLIKRLQDEIIDMSNDVEQPIEKENLEKPEASPHHLRINIDENEVDPNRKSHIYSVIVNDGGLISGPPKPFSDLKIPEPIDTSSTAELKEAFSNIRRHFSLLWDDVEHDDGTGKKEEMEHIEEHMGETLSDLKSKISEIINYQESRLSLYNSKEKLH